MIEKHKKLYEEGAEVYKDWFVVFTDIRCLNANKSCLTLDEFLQDLLVKNLLNGDSFFNMGIYCIPPTQLKLYKKLFGENFSYSECNYDKLTSNTLKLVPTVSIYLSSNMDSCEIRKYYHKRKERYYLSHNLSGMAADIGMDFKKTEISYYSGYGEEIIKTSNYRLLLRGEGSGLIFKAPACYFDLLQALTHKKILNTPKDILLLKELFINRFELRISSNYNHYNNPRVTDIQDLYYTDSEAMVTEYNLVTRKDKIGRLDGDTVYALYSKDKLFIFKLFDKKTDKLLAMSYYL